MLHLKFRALGATGLIFFGCCPVLPVWAGTCADLVVRIRDAKVLPNGGRCELVDLPDQMMVLAHIDGNYTADTLKLLASRMAQAMAPAILPKKMVIAFSDSSMNGRVTAVTISAEQAKILHDKAGSVEPSQLDSVLGEIAVVETGSALASSSTNAAMSNLQMERNKLTSHIEQLRGKRVGVKPFLDEIARADDYLKAGNVSQAKATLDHLSGAIDEYEQQMKVSRISGHAATFVQAPAVRQAPSVSQSVGAQPPSGAFGAAADRASANSLPKGTEAYYDEIANQILKRQVGDLAPIDGPMRLERFTIAKRLTTLRQSGADVNNYISAFRKIEEIAGSKDPQKVLLLRDEIQYLNKQLGLQ